MRLATLTAGMAFGEMALLKPMRPADAPADASILADRLIVANTKVNLLTAS